MESPLCTASKLPPSKLGWKERAAYASSVFRTPDFSRLPFSPAAIISSLSEEPDTVSLDGPAASCPLLTPLAFEFSDPSRMSPRKLAVSNGSNAVAKRATAGPWLLLPLRHTAKRDAVASHATVRTFAHSSSAKYSHIHHPLATALVIVVPAMHEYIYKPLHLTDFISGLDIIRSISNTSDRNLHFRILSSKVPSLGHLICLSLQSTEPRRMQILREWGYSVTQHTGRRLSQAREVYWHQLG